MIPHPLTLSRLSASLERNLGNFGFPVVMSCWSWLRLLARNGGMPQSISNNRILQREGVTMRRLEAYYPQRR